MGVPYSRQIDLAFEQVGPFLQTAKYTFLLLCALQVLATLFLGLVLGLTLLALLALLITVNPDLDTERRAIVTPVMRRMTLGLGRRSGSPDEGVTVEPATHRRSERSEKRK
ncbi:hypothetical protein CONLIGDRAFT_650367 [Coniochaeta ligniaria NRRL 30616]|uniref:Uncharacterized protein n=1 Tax=Coniochaeta ligniaria NRRL 30616 TaxID=1408157 RepID=A0A1J7J0L4_9PEZI|nr:hypothetical protein CONLIGDRAFT_650367 [Coniochaeta ligniaria NRRL 30616]